MANLSLKRPGHPRSLISLVPMIDVMMIMLVFFMVTSTYLNLDMIPAAERSDAVDPAPASANAGEAGAGTILIRLGADGIPVARGQALNAQGLSALLKTRLASEPLTQVLILPSGAARTQALITVMDIATQAGATRIRVVRLEALP